MEANWIKDIDDILRADDVRQLSEDLVPVFGKVTTPTKRAEEALNAMFNECLKIDPVRAMWVAWLLGAAWQRLADEVNSNH
jgi:hypothetical protein